jgi:uncharacterized protein (DUF433 family)
MNKYISIDPKICHGQACVKGTRIPVHQIIHMLASRDKAEEIIQDYPSLSIEAIHACLEYVASLAEEHLTPIEMIG